MQNNHPLRLILVDDQADDLAHLNGLLRQEQDAEVLATLSDPGEVLPAVISMAPDLLMMDIRMPGKDGFSVLEELGALKRRPEVVFVTSYAEYSIRAIRSAAFDYLMKPVDASELRQCLARYRQHGVEATQEADRYAVLLAALHYDLPLRFNTVGGFELLNPTNIAYCIADGNYTTIYRNDGLQTLVTRNIKSVHALLEGKRFCRISRQCLINLDNLIKFSRRKKSCTLRVGAEILSFDISAGRIAELIELADRLSSVQANIKDSDQYD